MKTKVDFWVWQEPVRPGVNQVGQLPGTWNGQSARILYATSILGDTVIVHNQPTREAAMRKVRAQLRQLNHGARLVPVPQHFAVAQGLVKGTGTQTPSQSIKTCACGAPLATAPGIGEYCTAGFKCTEGSGLQKQESGVQTPEYSAQFLGKADGCRPQVYVKRGKNLPGYRLQVQPSEDAEAFLRDLADLINEHMNLSKYEGELA